MQNKHYRVGYTLERDVKIVLEKQGRLVFRTAGSHGIADLIVFHETAQRPWLIQCKRHLNLMTKREIREFAQEARKFHCDPNIAYRDKGIHITSVGGGE